MSAQNFPQPQPTWPRLFDYPSGDMRQPFIAVSKAARGLLRQVDVVASRFKIATIEGEPGVGKETLAGWLHRRSVHAHENLQRSDAREWLMAEVDPQSFAGFVYLDRVDLLATPGQALLLRILRAIENRPAGTFALIASSEDSLRAMAGEGRFLPGLAFRMTAIHFAIPPLRERREDIAPLAAFFLERFSAQYRIPKLTLARGALSRLLQHDWPANARELSSVLESACLVATEGVLRAEDLSIISTPMAAPRPIRQSPPILNLNAVILNHIHTVLDFNLGNKLKTARQLGISRSTLYRLLADSQLSL
jgi:DNA-binding NtrC family response regulator